MVEGREGRVSSVSGWGRESERSGGGRKKRETLSVKPSLMVT